MLDIEWWSESEFTNVFGYELRELIFSTVCIHMCIVIVGDVLSESDQFAYIIWCLLHVENTSS